MNQDKEPEKGKRIVGNYIPPCSKEGSPIGKELDELYPGVKGYAVKTNKRIYIPMIEAIQEGSGQVGKFLDNLSPECVIPNIVSQKLTDMLKRRGWKMIWEWDEEVKENVDIWVHPAKAGVKVTPKEKRIKIVANTNCKLCHGVGFIRVQDGLGRDCPKGGFEMRTKKQWCKCVRKVE